MILFSRIFRKSLILPFATELLTLFCWIIIKSLFAQSQLAVGGRGSSFSTSELWVISHSTIKENLINDSIFLPLFKISLE